VDKTPVQVVLPIEHRADQLFLEAFFPELDKRDPSLAYRELAKAGKMQGRFLHTGKFVKKGERIFNFDIRTGDLLLVDRMRYHFTSPKIGDPVVFPTKKVPGLGETEDVYYIKRLVGLPGDELEVKGHTLYRNGQPIEGAPAFDLNAQQIGEYPGYKAEGRLAPGRKVTVPPNHYFVMGDNSPMSLDGRLWHGTSVFSNQNPLVGFVPEKEIIGRAVVILYPFSNRFGLAK